MSEPHAHVFESRSTVLVVEDDHDIRVSVRNLLEDEGYRVLSVTNGKLALDLLERAEPRPSLIILDLMLPVMDGWEFAEQLRERPRLARIPILIMSAYDEPPPPEGVVGFVKKPIDAGLLLNVVDRFCQ
jgi:two-component system, chemotaxis family, chemotaxis protein CheY